MLNQQYIENLTKLKGFLVDSVQEFDGKCHLFGQMERQSHSCPSCGTPTAYVHDYRLQIIKHIPTMGIPTVVHLRKRRLVCPNCGKRFYEPIPFLPRYQHTTNALWGYILGELTGDCSMKSIAKRTAVSQTTVARILNHVSYSRKQLRPVISLDEFRGNSGGEKFQCIVTDPVKKRVLDILPNRNSEDLCRYFSECSNRTEVKYVVMDLSSLFRSVAQACFPQAEIVADKFHALRLALFAFEQIRKEEQKKFHPDRRKYFKRSRRLLMKRKAKLTSEELEQVSLMLSLSPPIAQAYWLKELAYHFFDAPDIFEARKRLLTFRLAVETTNCRPFQKVWKTYLDWEKELLNIFRVPLSNGFTEGCNNRIKVMKRTAYGMRNFERFRARILHTFSQA